MRLSIMVLGFVCLCTVVIGIAAPALQDQDDVRGAFLTSRPKQKPANSGSTAKPNRRRPKSSVPPSNSGKTPEKDPGKPVTPSKPSSTEPSKPVNAPRLGIGLSLFMRDSNGLAVRTDP